MESIKFSVVICTFNGEKYIADQLKSIFDQSIKPFEIIISDDASTDNTVKIIRELIDNNYRDFTIKLYTNSINLGFIKNFNLAISYTSENYVFLSDQDDIWSKYKIEEFLKHIKSSPDYLLYFSNAEVIDEDNNTIKKSLLKGHIKRIFRSKSKLTKLLLKGNLIPGCTVCISKSLYTISQPFNNIPHDYWLVLNSLFNTNSIFYIDIKLIKYRLHKGNTIGLPSLSFTDKIKTYLTNISKLKKIYSYNRDVFLKLSHGLDFTKLDNKARYLVRNG
jgi:glycosyltransferase involved in cell wall biosynthesis